MKVNTKFNVGDRLKWEGLEYNIFQVNIVQFDNFGKIDVHITYSFGVDFIEHEEHEEDILKQKEHSNE